MNEEELNQIDSEEEVFVDEEYEKEAKETYFKFLADEVKTYCDSEGWYHADYDSDDWANLEEIIAEIVSNIEAKSYEEFENIVADKLYTDYTDNWDYESMLRASIEEDMSSYESEIVENYYRDHIDEFWGDLEKVGYSGVDYGIDDILDNVQLEVNLMVAPYNEQNYDMGSIVTSFGTDYLSPEIDWIDETYLDNGVTYLLHQQGHTVKELYDVLYGKTTESRLVKSLASEIENNSSESMAGLTVLLKLSCEVYGRLIGAVNSKLEYYVEVPQDAQLGLVNAWSGSGSVIEIELEKPFIFNAKDVAHITIEESKSNYTYSIGDIYGGIDRDTGISFTSAPELVQEDLAETLEYVKQTYGESEEE